MTQDILRCKPGDLFRLNGIITIEAHDLLGMVTDRHVIKNTITTAGQNMLRGALKGDDATLYYVGVGRGEAFTAAASDTCTKATHGFADDTGVKVYTTDTLPAGLVAGTQYYAKNTGADTFTLHSATPVGPGNIVDITDAGTGTHYIYKTPAVANTALYNETFRKAVTSYTEGAAGVLTTTCYISPSEATGYIAQIGFFGGATATATVDSGTLYSLVNYYRNKTNVESITVSRTDTITLV